MVEHHTVSSCEGKERGGVMRKTILIVLMVVVSGPAAAKWIEFGRSTKAVSYFNPAAIRRSGHTVKMWVLSDYATTQRTASGTMYSSVKAQYEYDCKDQRFRSLFASFYLGKMGVGENVLSLGNTTEWEPLVPDSVSALAWESACAKK